MEFKVRKESQSVLEKTFETYQRQNFVRGYQIASMLRTLRPDQTLDEKELENVLFRNDPEKTGKFDLATFNKIAIHFLVKAQRKDSDSFIHKKQVYLNDFAEGTEA